MSFIHPILMWGLLLAAIPVILHFLLKAKPKKLLFPALRLIQVRRRQNIQRMRLRHIWLLLLRIGVIALLVGLLARPRIPSANYAPTSSEFWSAFGILAVAAAAYFGLMRMWKQQRLAAPVLDHRRTFLGSAVALGVVLLGILLVLWPMQRRIAAEIKDPDAPVSQDIPVAAVLLFDTSLSMQYRDQNQTRLEVAQAIATAHISHLPARSRLAVADTSSANPILFQADVAGALNRIGTLETKGVSLPMNDRLRDALALQNEDQSRVLASESGVPEKERHDAYLREIYLFTDFADSAWRHEESSLLKEQLSASPSVNVYLIDVGVLNPQNVAVASLKLAESTVALGNELNLQATIEGTGQSETEATVELFMEKESEAGKFVKQGQQSVKLRGNEAAVIQFMVPVLTGTVRQGEVRLANSDPMPFDDIQYFTVEVLPPREVLVVADAQEDAEFWLQALAPTSLVKRGKARYRTKFIQSDKLAAENLHPYAAVCLIDVVAPRAAAWKSLSRYVEEGGGLAVILGTEVNPVSYDSLEAQEFLPAELKGHNRFQPPEYLDLQNVSHPMLKKFADWGAGPLTTSEISRYWNVRPADDAAVIAAYTHPRRFPAMIERAHGRGRSVMFTTSVSRNGWSDLPTAADWQYLAFADQVMSYLTHQNQGTFNFNAGEPVIVDFGAENPIKHYLLRKPSQQQLPGDVPAGKSSAVIRDVDQIGQYRVLAADPDSKFERGFSLNPAPKEHRLARVNPSELDELIGKDRYSQARSIEELDRGRRGGGRIPQEILSWILPLLFVVFGAEHLLANRFYDTDPVAAPEVTA